MPTTDGGAPRARRVFSGCESDLLFHTHTGLLVLGFTGGKSPRSSLHLVGGRLTFLVVHSERRNPGVLDCIDS